MERQDDPQITDDLHVYRRIPLDGGRITIDEETGEPKPSKSNFQDGNRKLSAYITTLTTPDKVLKGHPRFALVTLSVGDIREICREAKLVVCPDDEEPENGHILFCGNITQGMAKRLAKAAKWVEGHCPPPTVRI